MKKVKLLPSILMLLMCVGILSVGIFAATPVTNSITGTISVNAANSEVEITAYLNKVEETSKISDTFVTRKGATILLDSLALKFEASNVSSVDELHKKNIILQIKNNSKVKDLGAYFLTGMIGSSGTQLTNIATNKQLDGKMGDTTLEDVVSARFTHYTQVPKGGTANIVMELMLNQIYFEEVNVPVNLSVNIEEYDPSLAIVSDGTAWLSGTEVPTNALGETYDFYLDTDDYNIYKKEESGWVLIANIKGTDAQIDINANGYWVINGQTTAYKAGCEVDDIKVALSEIFDYVDVVFTPDYEPFSGSGEHWSYRTSIFSGWGGCIGKPQQFNTIGFKTRARDNEITKIAVYLLEENSVGTILYQEELTVSIFPHEVGEIQWVLPTTITNTNNINYYFAYACNTLCDLLSFDSGGDHPIPDASDDYSLAMGYFTNGAMSYNNLVNTKSQEFNIYIYVQTGMSTASYKFKDTVFEEYLNKFKVTTYTNNEILLPNNAYGYVGQTMQIYFENIIAYSLDEVLIRVETTNRGMQYTNRWEYTPTAAETFVLKISIYNKNFGLINEKSVNVIIKDATTAISTRAIVIGDSTVEAAKETAKMVELSESDGTFDLTLIGSLGSGANLHEGRGGWKAETYVTKQSTYNSYLESDVINAFYSPNTATFDFNYYMTQQGYDSVDVVYIQLGINDIFGAKSDSALETAIETYLTNLDIMIQSIKAYNSDIKVVVNLIIPCTNNQDAFTGVYGTSQTVWGFKKNMYFANMALLEKYGSSEGIFLSWYNAAIDVENNQPKDVHPSEAGYYQLGEQMYYMLKAIS